MSEREARLEPLPLPAVHPLNLSRRDPAGLGVDLDALGPLLDALGPIAVVDLETTGLATDAGSEIIELGAVLLDPGEPAVVTIESLFEPRGPLPGARSSRTTPTSSATSWAARSHRGSARRATSTRRTSWPSRTPTPPTCGSRASRATCWEARSVIGRSRTPSTRCA
jgi:hypothetical protein